MIKILISVIIFSNVAYALFNQCNEPFGQKLGASSHVAAYSNCNENVTSHQKNHIEIDYPYREYVTGLKWQSVEYARRWLIYNKGINIPKVKNAFSIWSLKRLNDLEGHQTIIIEKHMNKLSRQLPQIGDLVIYNQNLCKNGHVSVVVGIKPDSIMLAEQNYFNLPWEGIDYSRRLDLRHSDSGGFWIVDNHILGWIHPKRYSFF